MAEPFAIANWKLNVPPEGIDAYLSALSTDAPAGVSLGVAPPFPFVRSVSACAAVLAGAQNCADQKSGAYTGEVSATMLRDCGARFAIVGHSERRAIYGETDALVARRLAAALDGGLMPVLCIGEDLRTREAGHAARFLAEQVKATVVPALEGAGDVVVAYEPIWAIGTGRNATAAMVAETVGQIREAIGRFWPEGRVATPILYGGSVTPDNVTDLAANGGINGFLVGGASLDSGKFLAIARSLKSGTLT